MSRPSYLFRMFPDESDRLQRLADRYQGKREALAAALLALEQQVRTRDEERNALEADVLQRSSTLTARLDDLETRVKTLERQSPAAGRSSSGKSRPKSS